MGEIAFVVGQSSTALFVRLIIFASVVLIPVLVFIWLLSRLIRRIGRWFGRSLKARQDLARATADVAERLERIGSKLEEQGKAER